MTLWLVRAGKFGEDEASCLAFYLEKLEVDLNEGSMLEEVS